MKAVDYLLKVRILSSFPDLRLVTIRVVAFILITVEDIKLEMLFPFIIVVLALVLITPAIMKALISVIVLFSIIMMVVSI